MTRLMFLRLILRVAPSGRPGGAQRDVLALSGARARLGCSVTGPARPLLRIPTFPKPDLTGGAERAPGRSTARLACASRSASTSGLLGDRTRMLIRYARARMQAEEDK